MSASIPVFSDRPKAVATPKLRALVKFPGNVAGTTGISVEKENGTWTFALDYSQFATDAPTSPTSYVLKYDTATGVYGLVATGLVGGIYVDIREFGATTSAGDNRLSILAAIEAAGGLLPVLVPPGTFVSDNFTIAVDNTRLVIAPGGVLKRRARTGTLGSFITLDADGTSFDIYGSIDDNEAAQGGATIPPGAHGVRWYGTAVINASAIDAAIIRGHGQGRIVDSLCSGIYADGGTRLTVDGVTFERIQADGILCDGSNPVGPSRFQDLTFRDGLYNSITLLGNTSVSQGHIVDRILMDYRASILPVLCLGFSSFGYHSTSNTSISNVIGLAPADSSSAVWMPFSIAGLEVSDATANAISASGCVCSNITIDGGPNYKVSYGIEIASEHVVLTGISVRNCEVGLLTSSKQGSVVGSSWLFVNCKDQAIVFGAAATEFKPHFTVSSVDIVDCGWNGGNIIVAVAPPEKCKISNVRFATTNACPTGNLNIFYASGVTSIELLDFTVDERRDGAVTMSFNLPEGHHVLRGTMDGKNNTGTAITLGSSAFGTLIDVFIKRYDKPIDTAGSLGYNFIRLLGQENTIASTTHASDNITQVAVGF